MGTIRLYILTDSKLGKQFTLKEYPELEVFRSSARRMDLKRINLEQYFKGIHQDYKQYTKLAYGPVFGEQDPRNGFLFEHNTTEDIIAIDENDIPSTYESCDVITGDLYGRLQTDTRNVRKGVVSDYNTMCDIQTRLIGDNEYNSLIRDEWIPDRSFLLID